MASGSLRDVVKALDATLGSKSLLPELPDETQQLIQTYLDKHETTDEHGSQRLQDELLNLYNKQVGADDLKRGLFLAALRQLRPAIKRPDHPGEWWKTLLRPTIESTSQRKAAVSDAQAFALDVLVYDQEEDDDGEAAKASASFTEKLLEVYLASTENLQELDINSVSHDGKRTFIANRFESLLVAFGRKRPKALMIVIDQLVVQKKYRLQALSLLSTFVRYQPPHLHQVLQTPLLETLLKCLTIDTSTAVVSLALTALVMFLPHIPNSLVTYLPRLFLVYSRILCWERYTDNLQTEEKAPNEAEKPSSSEGDTSSLTGSSQWDELSDPVDLAFPTIPELIHYFTFLYGLYPLNFMSFIRKPRKYLKNANFPGAEAVDLDQAAIRNRSEQFRQVHLLHPNFYTMTIEAELTDLNRWMKSDPADVVAECMGLCVVIPYAPSDKPAPPPSSKLPDIPPAQVRTEDIPIPTLLSGDEDGATVPNSVGSPASWNGNSWRDTQSTALTSQFGDNALEPPSPVPTSPRQFQDYSRYRMSTLSSKASPALRPHDPAFLESPTLPATLVQNNDVDLQDMLQAKESLQKVDSRSGPEDDTSSHKAPELLSPRLQAYTQSLSTASRPHSVQPAPQDSQGNLAFLQREVMLLRNDLNFERYLKQQHLSHIGRLQRRYIKEATAEAETQNLVNTNKVLRLKLEDAKNTYAMLKKETAMSKSQQKKWEAELNAKIRGLREERKQWKAEETTVREALENAKKECDHLRRIAAETEAKELHSKQELQSLNTNLEEVESLRQEVETLNDKLREYQQREDEFEQQKMDLDTLRAQLEATRVMMRSRDADHERARMGYDKTISTLEKRIQNLGDQGNGQPPAGFDAMLDAALENSRERFNQLKKAHNHLLNRYNDLDMQYSDLKAAMEAVETSSSPYIKGMSGVAEASADTVPPLGLGNGISTSRSTDHLRDYTRSFASPTSPSGEFSNTYGQVSSGDVDSLNRGSRLPSMASQQGIAGAANVGSDRLSGIDPASPSIGNGLSREGSISSGTAKSDKDKPKIATNSQVRVYGRGGGQNIGLKVKEKKEKDPDKKSKSGFRGLRGFGG